MKTYRKPWLGSLMAATLLWMAAPWSKAESNLNKVAIRPSALSNSYPTSGYHDERNETVPSNTNRFVPPSYSIEKNSCPNCSRDSLNRSRPASQWSDPSGSWNDYQDRNATYGGHWERSPNGPAYPARDRRYEDRLRLPQERFRTPSYPSRSPRTNPYPSEPSYPAVPHDRFQPLPSSPKLTDEGEAIDREITARYQDPKMLNFLARSNMQQTMSLYMEASRLIDNRHVKPVSYEDRARRALDTLMHAVANPSFQRASGINPDPRQIRALQEELAEVMRANPPRTANESIGLMQWAANLANTRIGVKQSAVAMEFLNGSLDALDKYSAFVPSSTAYGRGASAALLQTAILDENIVGVGLELKKHEDGALVMGTIEGGPAARARLARGDIIVGVDGRDVTGLSLSQIADMISGPIGSTVTFRILRDGQRYTASMRRENVYVSSVTGARMLDRETGYVRLKQFSESSAEDLEKAMWGMYRNGMKSLVLDLRGNPGGLLTEAIEVSNLFVPCGRIVATRGRQSSDNTDEQATWSKTWRLPLVVLVDENSASASEIFAAAIQENQRGVIVGRQTYGKGTVQTYFPLQSVSGNLKLTTAKFYSPKGREMAGAGVRPDVPVSGETAAFGTEPIERDRDVQAALNVISQGTPATLAAHSGKCRPQPTSLHEK